MKHEAMGRPKTDIDWKFVDEHLQAQCDGVGIAGLLGIHPNTFYNAVKEKFNCDFSEYSAIKKGEGKELLRKKQMETALSGDKTLLVWLGKQYLDQKDKVENDHNINVQQLPDIIIKSNGE